MILLLDWKNVPTKPKPNLDDYLDDNNLLSTQNPINIKVMLLCQNVNVFQTEFNDNWVKWTGGSLSHGSCIMKLMKWKSNKVWWKENKNITFISSSVEKIKEFTL